jgi:tripartite-type tricarboxylate transporter receptor subunit TctC
MQVDTFIRALGRGGFIAVGVLTLAGTTPAPTGDSYPDRPIKLIVPFAPGGGGDSLARTVAVHAEKVLGTQLVIDNRAGAGGNIGTAAAAKAPSDGYTIVYGTNGTFSINHALYEHTGFDPIKDFAPVARLTKIAMVLAINKTMPVTSVPELLTYLRANPGKITFASAGNGTSSHVAGELFKMVTGVDIVHVPFRGNGPAMVELVGGRVNMIIDVMPSAFPFVQTGKLQGLAVTTKTRVPSAHSLPTLDESGVPGFEMTAWDGIWAPAGTPRPIIEKLNGAFNAALNDPQTKERLLARGAEPVPGTPEDLGRHVARELPKWTEVVKRTGARVE